ncbi:hypothetical protein R0G64_32845, partial [Pseudomonas otitidis]|nr:hypothetical protein [Pseudomonas otitidis]
MLDNQPWFVAVDFARLLGMQHPQTLHRRVGIAQRRDHLAIQPALQMGVLRMAEAHQRLVQAG